MNLIEDKLKVCEKQEDLAQLKIRTLEGKLHILETATKAWFSATPVSRNRMEVDDVQEELRRTESELDLGVEVMLALPPLPKQ